ncbi:hypothetical protein BpHYR1_027648 [Brachionus plicatilis]|uniref:Uncharacterized protein n=1 Tax=Brachionus plicatilis TaxID=10195 RepID=A0A3M7S3A4_BRAPC|nr:hypothetical protein BpHYR1_027648 [Brachionus plicatilis]
MSALKETLLSPFKPCDYNIGFYLYGPKFLILLNKYLLKPYLTIWDLHETPKPIKSLKYGQTHLTHTIVFWNSKKNLLRKIFSADHCHVEISLLGKYLAKQITPVIKKLLKDKLVFK